MQRTLGLAVCLFVGTSALAQTIHGREGITLPAPPAVEAVPVSDNYFGTKIPDSYRWLEDAASPETRAFIDAQNAYTARYLKQARIRPEAVEDLDALENVSETGPPIERANSYFFSRRLAGEQQFSIYVRHGWTGKDERLIDPAKLSRDPNTSIGLVDVSRDGTLAAYTLQQGGADEVSIHVLNVKTGKTLEDELPTALYYGVSFAPDGASIYYARSNKQGTLLYQHALGTRTSRDTLVFGNLGTDGTFPANFQRLKIPCVLNQLCRVSHRGTLWVGLFPAKAGRPTPHPKSHPKSIPRNFRPLTFFSNSCIVLTVIAAQLFYEHSTQFPDLSKGSRLILPPSQAENKYHVLGFEGTRVNIPSVPRFEHNSNANCRC